MNEQLNTLHTTGLAQLSGAANLEDLEQVRLNYFGKSGQVTQLLKSLGQMDAETRKTQGAEIHKLRETLQTAFTSRKDALEQAELDSKLAQEKVDITLPGTAHTTGKMHPVSATMIELAEILGRMGFGHAVGPEVETDYYNFSALNIPAEHPARQDHDTFYVETKDEEGLRKVLRTQTSNVQIRHLQNNPAPARIVSFGRVYRHDYDATHTPQFHQMEGLAIDKDLTLGHLKGTIQKFLNDFFGREVTLRFRIHYFPFVEPGLEVDVAWPIDQKADEKTRWLEVMGAGMVHRNVLAACGVDHTQWQGFAFGAGIERLAMLKHGFNDIRQLFTGRVDFLQSYGQLAAKLTAK